VTAVGRQRAEAASTPTRVRESVLRLVWGVENPLRATCAWCGSVIDADKRADAVYCCARCRRRAWAARHGTPIVAATCWACGELLTGRRADARWCSDRCRMRSRREALTT
jgi:hypothetical protein